MTDAVTADAVTAGYELARARWPEVAAWPRRLLVVPVGSVEQHGPHLPLDTDTRIASAVALRACAVAAANAGAWVSSDVTQATGTARHTDPAGDAGRTSNTGRTGNTGAAGNTDPAGDAGRTGDAGGPGTARSGESEAAGIGLAPPISIGASGEHADFPGTLSIGHVALSTLLVELGRHASLHWPAMLIVNGHGGNVSAIDDALRKLRAEGRDCHVWHAGVRPSMLAAAGLTLVPDAHAGRVETSIMLALSPGDVRLDVAAAGDARPLAEVMPTLREHGVGGVSANGVLGNPTGASAAEGETLLRLLTADLAATIARLAEVRPLPVNFLGGGPASA
jgi:creatinine amidohydrolase